jgi:peptidoglycan/xylan/chitin deacetylase (PgdA/CDA1 family)
MLALLLTMLISYWGMPQLPSAAPPVAHPVPTPAVAPVPASAAPVAPPVDASVPGSVPILMYHVLAAAKTGAPYADLYVLPTEFEAQMDYLSRSGYQAVTLQRLYDHWHKVDATPWPARPIIISFDDGLRNQAQVAGPILAARGWPGVLNLVVDHYRQVPSSITLARVRRLAAAGWEIDSHTVTHRDLTTLTDAQLTDEVANSRADLQTDLGAPVNFFCYPSGRHDQRTVAAVRAAGYLAATTTEEGLASSADQSFELPRVRVHAHESVQQFAASLTG